MTEPLSKSKKDYGDIIATISSDSSTVGIDAQYTHAIIIEYLRNISERISALEKSAQKISDTP